MHFYNTSIAPNEETLKLFLFFLLFSLSSKAQVCDSLVRCDSINKAITDLQKYHVGGDTVTYSAAFIDGYLNLRYPNYGYSPAKWDSIIRCCTPAHVDLNNDTSSHCENLLFVRLYMQNLFPSRACLPAWLYTYLLNQITPSIPDVTDTTVQELCRELATCKYTCLNYCDTAIITQCDSVLSTYYATKNVNYAEGITDTNTLVNAYGILFGYTLPYNSIMAMVNNCNPNDTAVFTEITYSAQNITYSTDTLGHNFVDLDVFAIDSPAGLLYSQSEIYIQYDSAILGTNLVTNGLITASKGLVIDSPYYNVAITDSTPSILKIAITHADSVSTLPTIGSNQQLCHLRINLSGFNFSAINAYFDTVAMAGQSKYKFTPNGLEFPYDKVLVNGLRSNTSLIYNILNVTYSGFQGPNLIPTIVSFTISVTAGSSVAVADAGMYLTFDNSVVSLNYNNITPPLWSSNQYDMYSSSTGYIYDVYGIYNLDAPTTDDLYIQVTHKNPNDNNSPYDPSDVPNAVHEFTATSSGETFIPVTMSLLDCGRSPNLKFAYDNVHQVWQCPLQVNNNYGIPGTGGQFSIVPYNVTTINNASLLAPYCVTGIQNIDSDKTTFNVYPNPFTEIFILNMNLNKSQEINFDLTDILGQTIYTQALGKFAQGNHKKTIDVPKQLDKGVYFAIIHFSNSETVIKLIKQ